MPDESDIQENEDQTLAVPGVISVSPVASGKKRVRVGPSAGWMVAQGLMGWERELSFLVRADATADLAAALRCTLPHEQIAPKRFAMAARAAMASPILAISSNLVAEARSQGARVYTVGVDRVSAGFYYFAEGGAREPVRVQGNLVEMLAPALTPATTNAEIEALLEGLIERLLLALSEGMISDLDVELADSLPRLSRDGTGLEGTNLEAFDASARQLALQSGPWESLAVKIVDALAVASSTSLVRVSVPLYGEARREARAALEVQVGGKTLQLPEQPMWMVTGGPREGAWATSDYPQMAAVSEQPLVARAEPDVPAAATAATVHSAALESRVVSPEPALAPAPATLAEPQPPVTDPTPSVAVAPAPAVAPVPAVAPAPAEVASESIASALAPGGGAAPVPTPPATPAAEAEVAAPKTADGELDSAPVETPPSIDASESRSRARPVPAVKQDKVVKTSRPFPSSALLLIAAIVYFVLRKMHWIH